MTIKIAFSIDDVCPKAGFGLYKDFDALKWPLKLHEEFGCKFTLFVIPYSSEESTIDKHDEWLQWLANHPAFEIAQHGLTHAAKKPEFEAQEFADAPLEEVYSRIVAGKKLFENAGVQVVGFKSPGWTQPKEIYQMLSKLGFSYIGDHFIGQKPLRIGNLRRIPYTLSIERLHSSEYKDDYLILHSHIHPGDRGQTLNAWNEKLYHEVRNFILDMKTKNNVEFVFFKDVQ